MRAATNATLPAQQADIVPSYRPGASAYDQRGRTTTRHGNFRLRRAALMALAIMRCRSGRAFADEQEPVGSLGRQLPGFPPQSPRRTRLRRPGAARRRRSSLRTGGLRGGSPRRPPAQRLCRRSRGPRAGGARNRRRVCLSRHVRQLDAALAAADHQGGRRTEQDRAQQAEIERVRSSGCECAFRRKARLARGAASRHAGAGEPGAAGGIDHSDFPRSEFRSGRSSELRARRGLASGGPAFPAPPAPAPTPCRRHRLRRPSERYADLAGAVDLAASLTGQRRIRRDDGSGVRAHRPRSSTAPKKIHTVVIRSDQAWAGNCRCVVAPPRRRSRCRPLRRRCGLRPLAPPHSRRRGRCRAPRAEANGPLSIVPDQGGAAPAPARIRTALVRVRPSPMRRSAREPPPSAGGGYAVQVTSQRSEAEAQAEFRALRAKFPTQLGGREPIIRRADLGAKGVYYRALVGPVCLDGPGGRHVLEPESGRRHLHRPTGLRRGFQALNA